MNSFLTSSPINIYCYPDAPVRDMIGAGSPDAPFYMKFLAGAITGGVGSIIGNVSLNSIIFARRSLSGFECLATSLWSNDLYFMISDDNQSSFLTYEN